MNCAIDCDTITLIMTSLWQHCEIKHKNSVWDAASMRWDRLSWSAFVSYCVICGIEWYMYCRDDLFMRSPEFHFGITFPHCFKTLYKTSKITLALVRRTVLWIIWDFFPDNYVKWRLFNIAFCFSLALSCWWFVYIIDSFNPSWIKHWSIKPWRVFQPKGNSLRRLSIMKVEGIVLPHTISQGLMGNMIIENLMG